MNGQDLKLEANDFIATCRALKAASRGSHRFVELRFEPATLAIEGEMGGGVLRTTGNFTAKLTVPYGILAKVALLHRPAAKTDQWINCTVDEELREIRFPLGGIKARFTK